MSSINIRVLMSAFFPQHVKGDNDNGYEINIKESIPERPDLKYCDLTYVWNNQDRCFVLTYEFTDDHGYQQFTVDIPENYTKQSINDMLDDIKRTIIVCKTDKQIQENI